MTLYLIAFLGGVLTIVSPCILPVLPFVFTRTGQPFLRSGLPMLVGMAVTFAAVASLAAVGGAWAVQANQFGRWMAIVIMIILGLALILPGFAARLTAPVVRLGERLSSRARADGSPGSSVLLGIATGLLWAPCAGPILGLILGGAALEGANARTTLLLLCFALGASVSLALVLLGGGRIYEVLKRSLRGERWIRAGMGVAVILAAGAIALGLDTGFLTNLSLASTTQLEEGLFKSLLPEGTEGGGMMAGPGMEGSGSGSDPVTQGPMPPLDGATHWLNSDPLASGDLRGKVVLIDFWTYSCINCLRTLPYVKAWEEKYRDQGLVVIGVHTPEFAFEKDLGNVQRQIDRLGISYPVAIDNDYGVWRAFSNRFWPAHYFIDAEGNIRHWRFGEGGYEESERVIQELLAEAGNPTPGDGLVEVDRDGVAKPPDLLQVFSPETYIGYERAENFLGTMGRDLSQEYSVPETLSLNQWGLEGQWTVGPEAATLDAASGGIVFRFYARDLNLVLGSDQGPVDFRVTVDGQPPGEDHGLDVDAEGFGTVSEHGLYQLVREAGAVTDRLFEIQFFGRGVSAYAFTFG